MFSCVSLTALHKYLDMPENLYENDHSFHTKSNKTQNPIHQTEFAQPHTKRMRYMRVQKIHEKKKKKRRTR